MGQANRNPRSLQGVGRNGKTEDAVNEARLRSLLSHCSGPEELRQYVALNFGPREQDAVYRYLLTLAPWAPSQWAGTAPRPDAVDRVYDVNGGLAVVRDELAEPVFKNDPARVGLTVKRVHPYSSTCECDACAKAYFSRKNPGMTLGDVAATVVEDALKHG